MQSTVPMGLKIPAYSPTDKSVGCFHLSLWDKTQVYKNLGMHLIATLKKQLISISQGSTYRFCNGNELVYVQRLAADALVQLHIFYRPF